MPQNKLRFDSHREKDVLLELRGLGSAYDLQLKYSVE